MEIGVEAATSRRCASLILKDPGGSQINSRPGLSSNTFSEVRKDTSKRLHGVNTAVEAEAYLFDRLVDRRRVVSERPVILFLMQHQNSGLSQLTPKCTVFMQCPCVEKQDLVEEAVEAVKLPDFEPYAFFLVLEAAESRVVAGICGEEGGAVARCMTTPGHGAEKGTAREPLVGKRIGR